MVVKRKISKEKYILAGVLTFLIFGLGLTLGVIIDNYRVKYIEEVSKLQELEYKSIHFQYLYLTTLEDGDDISCPVLKTALEKTISDLSDSLNKFAEYEEETQLNQVDYELAARHYLLDNLRYWLFAKKSKEACGLDMVSILYFYSEDCSVCPNQGIILTYFKKIFKEKVLIFPINVDLENEPMIDIFMQRYNVTSFPTLVIEDERHEGIMMRDELGGLICSVLEESEGCAEIEG